MLGLLILLGVALALVLLVLSIIMLRQATHPPRRTAAYAVARNLPVDPGEMNLAHDQWNLERPDGAELPVWGTIGRRTLAARITAVFVHGWGHSRIDSLSRITPWLQWCDRVVLYDLRGHGEASDGITWLGFREDDDLLALLERLAAERDDRFL